MSQRRCYKLVGHGANTKDTNCRAASTSEFPWTPLSLDLPKLSCSRMMPKAGTPRALTISLGCAWPRDLTHSKDDIRLIGFITIRPHYTLGGHSKRVHFELVVHCAITGGCIAVHSKDAIRLAMLLALCPNLHWTAAQKHSLWRPMNKQYVHATL